MLKRFLAGAALSALLMSPVFAQTKQVETVTKKGSEIVIPYQKYKLANGLTLIVHEDHSDPIVHVDVTYHVGSAREEIGKSGFAHFFEHMMFQGSDHVGDEQHFKIVSESGGSLNGTTNRDRTNYFETLPSNQLETALWLEADRMGFLLDAVTQKKFEVQRSTVKNERGQRYDNVPYGQAQERLGQAMYPYGHPYSWLTIGYLEDLNRVDVNDLKNFFLRWYGPNNAVVTVGGDVKPDQAVKLVEKYFGSIPAGPAVLDMTPMRAKLDKDRYIHYEDNVRFPQLSMVFPGVEMYAADEPALDALGFLIGQGENSILYKNFVLAQKGVSAFSFHNASELSGEFMMVVRAYPGTNLKDTEALLRQSLADFEKKGVSDDDLARFKATTESQTINSLASVSGKVSQLAAYETFAGNANYIGKDLARYNALTKEDIMRVYNTYIKGKPAVLLSVVPKGKADLIAAANNYEVSKEGYKAAPDQYSGLKYNKAKDSFDRSKRPASGSNPVVTVPNFWTQTLKNGAKVLGAKNDEIPTVAMQITLEGGHLLDAHNPSKAGLAVLTANMMNEASQTMTAEEISAKLDKLGSSINIYATTEQTIITVESLKKNLAATLALLEERLYKPKFAQEDFDRLKKQQLEQIGNQSTQASVMADNAFNKVLYGKDHILSIPNIGNESTVTSITLEDVKNFYNKYYSPAVANVVVVGDIDEKETMSKLAFLNKWEKKPVTIPTFTAAKGQDKTKIFILDKTEAPQSEIRIGYVAMPFDATGTYYKLGLMNHNLGGDFNSRINLNLREDKGWTYGARSGFSGSKYSGAFTAAAGVRGNATDSAVYEFMKEIKTFNTSGIKDEELAFMRSSIGQADARKYETPLQKAGFLSLIARYNLNKDFVAERNKILANITKAEINGLAKQHLAADKFAIMVVGDKKSIKPGLEKLGYEVIELDKNGNPLPAGGASGSN